MSQPLAYVNGQFVDVDQLSVPVTDAGFVLGVTVAEQLRTFAGRLFRLDAHLKRLARSLEIIQLDPRISIAQLGNVAAELVSHNHALLAPGDDLGLSIFITPGPYATFVPHPSGEPLVGLHSYAIPFCLWADKYTKGQRVVITDVEQISAASWPAELKCRSRMHYYLADRKAQALDPDARAVLLDRDGFVSESSTANVVAYFQGEGLVSPPREKILPGISIAVTAELAEELGIPFVYRDLAPGELRSADESFLASTSPCVLPVVSVDGRPIGRGVPGEVFHRLIGAWSKMVQLDIVAQAARFASR
jgi:branched-subunit amino acid aminotransferase/4-amino-4-deoxychorismate lyase